MPQSAYDTLPALSSQLQAVIQAQSYIDATRGRSIPQQFIAYHVVPVVKKEKPFQDTFAETLCYTMMLGEVILPLVVSMYVLGQISATVVLH